jgi:hypothetical protein
MLQVLLQMILDISPSWTLHGIVDCHWCFGNVLSDEHLPVLLALKPTSRGFTQLTLFFLPSYKGFEPASSKQHTLDCKWGAVLTHADLSLGWVATCSKTLFMDIWDHQVSSRESWRTIVAAPCCMRYTRIGCRDNKTKSHWKKWQVVAVDLFVVRSRRRNKTWLVSPREMDWQTITQQYQHYWASFLLIQVHYDRPIMLRWYCSLDCWHTKQIKELARPSNPLIKTVLACHLEA